MISSTKSLPFAIALAIALAPAALAQGEKTTYPYEIGSFDPTAAELRSTALVSEDQCPDFTIYDYTAADCAILVDALKRYLASHRATRLQLSLYVTFDNYSRIPADAAYDGETKKYWDGLLGQALEIEEGVTYLGENAFRNVPGLSYEACQATLPEGLGLGAYAFRDQQTAITPTPSPDPEEPAITLPEGAGDGAPFDETAQTALREAARQHGLSAVNAVIGRANGRTMSTAEMNTVLTCFTGDSLITADPDAQTLTVAVVFQVAGLTWEDGQLRIVATATAADGSALSVTGTAQIAFEEVDSDGTATGTLHTVEPVRESGRISFTWNPAADGESAPGTRLFRIRIAAP